MSLATTAAPHVGRTPVVEAVIFDMDGLLLNTEALARQALQLAGDEVGVPLTEAFCASLIGVPVDSCRQLLFEAYGPHAPADALFAASTRHLKAQIDAGMMMLKPGALELLAYLDEQAIPRAVATSSVREKALHHLERAGIADRFDAILTRSDVPRGKPYPDLYLAAAQALGTAPANCLALEDSYNGVRAAHAADIAVIMVPDLLPATPEMHIKCLAVYPDLHGVADLLAAQPLPEGASPS
ncbi:MAG: phosphatase [Polaromonas sp.]|jgi:HAD superfamily hydrolase (TIGR01509 family)|nr:phosphatase [Polaromonas sp.]